MIALFFAPESPWWLVRHGRRKEALRSIQRLGRQSQQNADEKLAMIERTVEIERQVGGSPRLLDLVKGTDLRRTIITCLIYASQNFAGNLIANQATYFFERESVLMNLFFVHVLIFFSNRGWHVIQLLVPAQFDQLMPPVRRKCSLVASHCVVRPSDDLLVGHCSQLHVPDTPRDLRIYPSEQCDELRASRTWYSDLIRLRWHTRTNHLYYHRRNVFRATSCVKHWRWTRCILRRRNSDDLSRLQAAKFKRLGCCGQVRICLGWHCCDLLGLGLLLPP